MNAPTKTLLYLATTNKHKLNEFSQMLSPKGVRLKGMEGMGLADIPEDGHSFAENAMFKAKTLFDKIGEPTLADDSGLEVDALNGAPGIYSARYANAVQNSDKANRQKLLEAMKAVPDRKRRAHFVCALAYCTKDHHAIFEGRLHGTIIHREQGEGGFGYDCIFQADGEKLTLAEIPQERKNQISHRCKALDAFCAYFENTTNSLDAKVS